MQTPMQHARRWFAVAAITTALGCSNHAKSTDNDGGVTDASVTHADGSASKASVPDGWLYTDGNKVYLSHGKNAGTVWVGRGVNVDDIYFCGYNYMLQNTKPEDTLKTELTGLLTNWRPTFLRISLSMGSFPATLTSWTSDEAKYKTPMTDVINSIGTTPNVYVLVTLRSHESMISLDTVHGDAEATGIPSDATTSPDKTKFPTGTDAQYIALVDTFAQSSFVLFGITNEPGGNLRTDEEITAAMDHAVGVIRKEEDKLGVPHHVVSVQGNSWTSNISFYKTAPIAHDNVVYEVHGYPPTTDSYTYDQLPVIVGEYGSLNDADAFFADLEAKQIPSLAWDFDPFSNCAPDLVEVDHMATALTPTDWGKTVKAYLTKHNL